jgi:hypothetical protein
VGPAGHGTVLERPAEEREPARDRRRARRDAGGRAAEDPPAVRSGAVEHVPSCTASGSTVITELIPGPDRSNASIRARYHSTSPRQVVVPAAWAARMSATVASIGSRSATDDPGPLHEGHVDDVGVLHRRAGVVEHARRPHHREGGVDRRGVIVPENSQSSSA